MFGGLVSSKQIYEHLAVIISCGRSRSMFSWHCKGLYNRLAWWEEQRRWYDRQRTHLHSHSQKFTLTCINKLAVMMCFLLFSSGEIPSSNFGRPLPPSPQKSKPGDERPLPPPPKSNSEQPETSDVKLETLHVDKELQTASIVSRDKLSSPIKAWEEETHPSMIYSVCYYSVWGLLWDRKNLQLLQKSTGIRFLWLQYFFFTCSTKALLFLSFWHTARVKNQIWPSTRS